MNNEKIIFKVKALLAKAEATNNQNEKQVFFQKAQELIVKHQLSASDMERISKEKITGCYSDFFKRTYFWHIELARVIGTNHNCLFYRNMSRSGVRVVFFGYEDAAMIATMVFNSCLLQLAKKSNSYRLGFVEGLTIKYQENWESYGLVPVIASEVNDAYKEIKLGKSQRRRPVTVKINSIEYQAGVDAGLKQLAKKIDSPKSAVAVKLIDNK